MKVRAKYQIAYKDRAYKGGDVFEMKKEDFEKYYKNDVIEIKKPNPKKPKTKSTKSKK